MKILGQTNISIQVLLVFLFPNLPPQILIPNPDAQPSLSYEDAGTEGSLLCPGETVLSGGRWGHHLTGAQGALTEAGFVLHPFKRSSTCGPSHKHHHFSFLSSSAQEENLNIKFR